MGLFDTGIQVGSGYQELADKLAGGLEKHTGYVSPQRQLRRAVSQTDLSDSDSVQKTFQMLMQKSPQDAVQWLNSIKPIIAANIEQEKLRLQGMTKPRERKIIKDAQGRQRYVDTGDLVFPGVSGKPPEAPKQQDLPQMNVAEKERITELVDATFDFGIGDAWFTGQPDAPKGFSEKELVDFVFSYSQIKNIPPIQVIKGLKDGVIDPTQPVGTASSTLSSSPYSGTGSVPNVPLPK